MVTTSGIGVLKDRRITSENSLNPVQDGAAEPVSAGLTPPNGAAGARIAFDRFLLDLERGCLLSGGEEIELRPKTFEILRYLSGRPGRLVSKDELMAAVWPGVVVTDDSLFQCIAELRRALQDHDQRLIKTMQRRGYRFELAVSLEPRSAAGHADAVAISAAAGAPPSPPEAPARSGRPRRVAMRVGLGALLIVTAGFAASRWWFGAGGPSTAAPLSLVVLPFTNLGDDPDQAYFAAAVTVDLTTDLSRLPGALVISPATAQTFTGKAVDARQVGRDLNVRYLVEGSVARSGKDVRVNVQLIDAATGSQLWAERFVRERDALPAWQDEIVAGIASALNFRLTRIESDRALRERPRNPEAYDLTTRGWALIYTAKKPENYAAARALFDQALLRDPQAVNALAGVGWVCVLSVLNGWSASPADDLAIAKRAAEQLLAIDPNHVMAHHVRGVGLRLERRTEAARDAFRTAVTLNPNFAPGHAQLGMAELELGRPEESIRAVERATRLSPRDPNVGHWIAFIGMAELHRGRYAEAVAWLTRSVNTGTASPTVLQRAYLIGALALAGRKAEAQGALTELLKAKPGTTIALLQRNARSTDARFVAQQQRLYEGLRLAGLPE